jgi:hypothetical protein
MLNEDENMKTALFVNTLQKHGSLYNVPYYNHNACTSYEKQDTVLYRQNCLHIRYIPLCETMNRTLSAVHTCKSTFLSAGDYYMQTVFKNASSDLACILILHHYT